MNPRFRKESGVLFFPIIVLVLVVVLPPLLRRLKLRGYVRQAVLEAWLKWSRNADRSQSEPLCLWSDVPEGQTDSNLAVYCQECFYRRPVP